MFPLGWTQSTMNTEHLGASRVVNWLVKPAGMMMGSRVRGWLMSPMRTLRGAGLQPGETVLEVGCGTGFFTIPAAQLVGDEGRLVAMDPVSDYVEQVSRKVDAAALTNVEVIRRDALNTGLGDASIDAALLFGVLPWPALPLKRLLPEMHRVLKPEGRIAVWLFPPLVHSWVHGAISRSDLFGYLGKLHGVYRYTAVVSGANHAPVARPMME